MLDYNEYLQDTKETEQIKSDILHCINNMYILKRKMRIETRPKSIF